MSRGKAKPKKMKCRICGAAFMALKRNARHCEACRAALRRADNNARYMVKTGKLAADGFRAFVEAAAGAGDEERRRKEAANRPRCPYCGNVWGVDKSGYCAACRSTGLDLLHKETGCTDGWDRPARAKVAVEGGWRGRPVAGCSRKSRAEEVASWA